MEQELANLLKTANTLLQFYTFYLLVTWGWQLWKFFIGA